MNSHDSPKQLEGQELDKVYRYWRIRTLYAMYIGYAAFYITRKSVTYAAPELMSALSLTAQQLGMLGTVSYIAYGVSKFISGALSDRSNPRYFMSIGLLVTAITNLLFGLSSTFWLFCSLWALNGFFQGWGWPPCSRLLTHWYAKKERGFWWGIWNTSHNLGGAIAPMVAVGCAKYFNHSSIESWRMMMFMPAVAAALISLFLYDRLRDVPESQGLPPIEEYKHEATAEEIKQQIAESASISIWQNFVRHVLTNHYIWLLAFAYVTVYIVRTAFNDWGTLYFSQHGLSNTQARTCLALFEVGGFVGSLLAGWFSDRIFGGMRGQINFLFCVGVLAVTVIVTALNITTYQFTAAAAISLAIGFFIFGPQMMIGVTAAELSHRESAGVATGFVGLFGYLGAALSGYPIGCIIAHYQWKGFLMALVVCSVISAVLLLPMVKAKQR